MKKTLTVKEYIQQFTVKERAKLAIQIDTKLSYLNRLAVKTQRPCGYRLAKDMQRSDFNAELPLDKRLTPRDLAAHKLLVDGDAE